jgi:hypothetical protein
VSRANKIEIQRQGEIFPKLKQLRTEWQANIEQTCTISNNLNRHLEPRKAFNKSLIAIWSAAFMNAAIMAAFSSLDTWQISL